MRVLCRVLLLVFTLLGVASAQQVSITPDMPVNSGLLQQWLGSGDARLIAWAADFAGRTEDLTVLAELPGLLEKWTAGGGIDGEARDVVTVLDTLIQQKVAVPMTTVRAIALRLPAQAAILISRVPLSESRETLIGWTYETTGRSRPELARIASMMLAREPEPGFVAGVVAASEETLAIVVRDTPGGRGPGMGAACGDSLGVRKPDGWPALHSYLLEENDHDVSALAVVDLDGDFIAARRVEEGRGWGSCYGVRPLDAETRHRLLAHWLGVPERNMAWQPVESRSIIWTDKATYEKEVGALVEAEREKLAETVARLRQVNLLTGGQADYALPRLIVTVSCDIRPCPLR